MRARSRSLDASDRLRAFGPLPLRLFAATFLVYMSQDNVFDAARMDEFVRFLGQFGLPFPTLGAHVSVYAQFGAGLLFVVGLWVRPAALVMIGNFLVALGLVHTRAPFREALDPSAMLAVAVSLLLTGAGALSIDGWRAARRAARAAPVAGAQGRALGAV